MLVNTRGKLIVITPDTGARSISVDNCNVCDIWYEKKELKIISKYEKAEEGIKRTSFVYSRHVDEYHKNLKVSYLRKLDIDHTIRENHNPPVKLVEELAEFFEGF